MIEIITEKLDMPKIQDRRYKKFPKDNGLRKWYVFDTVEKKTVYKGSFENVSLACYNLNKKYYKELSETTHNKDCAVTQSEIASPKSSDDDFAQS